MIEDLVYDIGMHRACDTEFYLDKGFRVIAVEANPALCNAAATRLSPFVERKALTILNVGIHKEAGTLEFFVNNQKDDWSSFFENFARRAEGVETIKVECRPLDDVIREFGTPYYLKIDVEGCDALCIDALESLDERPKYVSVEATVQNFSNQMSAWGYKRFKIISQVWNQFLDVPFPPREGVYVKQKMTGHHSGPFGEESYGPWLSAPQFDAELRHIQQKEFRGSLHERIGCSEEIFLNSWWDFHAARD